MSPGLVSPSHLAPLAEALSRAEREPLRLIVNTPPQHGKSTLTFHWLAHILTRHPTKNIIYLTYSSDFAQSQMRLALPIAKRAGVQFAPTSRSLCEWQTTAGGSLWATGLNGSITGRPGDIVVIDDPVKGWAEAQSMKIRDTIETAMRSDVISRINARTPIIVIQTRWHEDDISGRLIKEGWDRINLKAIKDDGTALWPEERPLAFLEEQRSSKGMGAYLFSALFQGEPRPPGGRVFNGVNYYTERPNDYRAAIGLDLAYTSKTQADYSVSIVLGKSGDKFYVLDMQRRQVSAPEFALTLRNQIQQFKGAPILWYYAGAEKSAIDFMNERGIPVRGEPAVIDKFARAQKVAAAWNEGRVLVPENAPWIKQFLAEILDFTGLQDAHDDIVDALAAAFNSLNVSVTSRGVMSSGTRVTSGLKNYY